MYGAAGACHCGAIPGVGDGRHHGRIVEADGHLDQGIALFGFLHLGRELGVVLRRVGHRHRGADVVFGVSVGTDAVADLSAKQLVDRQSGRLAGDIPERDFDGTDGRAPGLGGAQAANLQHDRGDVGWVLADEILFIKQHHRLEIGLGRFRLTVSGNSLVGNDANRRIAADDGALEVGNLDRPACLCCFRGIHCSRACPASEHGCPCDP